MNEKRKPPGVEREKIKKNSKKNAKGTKSVDSNPVGINSVVDRNRFDAYPDPMPIRIRILPQVANMLENIIFLTFINSNAKRRKCHNFQYFYSRAMEMYSLVKMDTILF
jgi:hypothetical protein